MAMKADLLFLALRGMREEGKSSELGDREWEPVLLLAQDIVFDMHDEEKAQATAARPAAAE